jgi:CheY-like chemotaxis protein
VEDNMVNSNLLHHHIKKFCHVFFSQTGKAAIELAKREKIDAIFMDINLGPGMDGTQAMLEIRKQTGHQNLPIIAVTGFAGREEREKFLKSGFSEFIAKPFERSEIICVIDKLFKLQQ